MPRFRVTPQHLALLQRMHVGWCDDEFGAPEIDPKRPYGSSDVYLTVYEILGGANRHTFDFNGIQYTDMDEEITIPNSVRKAIDKLHHETQTALQICLRVQAFEVGLYECSQYDTDWHRVEESNAQPG